MRIFFFNYAGDLEEISNQISKKLEISGFFGDSLNTRGGYFDFTIFGLNIKLELNTYDYEDQYLFMLSIRKDLISSVIINTIIENKISDAIKELLFLNLNISIVEELNG